MNYRGMSLTENTIHAHTVILTTVKSRSWRTTFSSSNINSSISEYYSLSNVYLPPIVSCIKVICRRCPGSKITINCIRSCKSICNIAITYSGWLWLCEIVSYNVSKCVYTLFYHDYQNTLVYGSDHRYLQ